MPSVDDVQDIAPLVQYTAAGGQTVFAYPFPIFEDDNLTVYDDDTLEVLTTHYTVSGAGNDTGGNVTFLAGRTDGHIITIYRNVAMERLTDFSQNGPRRSADMNDELDRITMYTQQLKRDIGRSIRLSLRNPQASSELELDPISNWEDRYLYINPDGELEPAVNVGQTTITQSIIGQLLYPQTAAEIAAGVTPVNYAYAPGNAFRYGATGDGATDDTAALQSWLDVAEQLGFGYLPSGNYKATSLTLTLTGNRITQSVLIHGDGPVNSRITKGAGVATLFTVQSNAPTTTTAALMMVFRDIGFFGNAKSAKGFFLNACAQFLLQNVLSSGHTVGFYLESSLVGIFRDCVASDNNYGYQMLRGTIATPCNDITIDGGRIVFNSTWGVDYNEGSRLRIEGNCDIEGNGTAANANTGGIHLGGDIQAETGFGFGQFTIASAWIEGNNGSSIKTDVQTASDLDILIEDVLLVSSDVIAINIAESRRVEFRNFQCFGTSDDLTIVADQLKLQNIICGSLTDTVTYPEYDNATVGAAFYAHGRYEDWTGTLTGVSGTVTGTIRSVKYGNTVRNIVPDLIGTSNSTACTITGMPAAYRPAASKNAVAIIQDNNIDDASQAVVESSGTITLIWRGGNFTNSGQKGIRAGDWPPYTVA